MFSPVILFGWNDTQNFSYSLAQLRALGDSIYVHSLPRGKERTKKTRQDVPSWNSLSVPLYKAG